MIRTVYYYELFENKRLVKKVNSYCEAEKWKEGNPLNRGFKIKTRKLIKIPWQASKKMI